MTITAYPVNAKHPIGKLPDEELVIPFRFAKLLDTGEALITTPTAPGVPEVTDLSGSADLTIEDVEINGTNVTAKISGGAPGEDYPLQCLVYTDGDQRLGIVGWLQVRDGFTPET